MCTTISAAAALSQPDFHVNRSLIDAAYDELFKQRERSLVAARGRGLRFLHDHPLETVNAAAASTLQQALPAALRQRLAQSAQLRASG